MTKPDKYFNYYNTIDPRRWGRAEISEMPQSRETTERWLLAAGVRPEAIVLELGCGVGLLKGVHPNYHGMDFSLPALQSCGGPIKRVQGDMQCLPFRDQSVDFIFSWASLEHVPQPELALAEIQRILKPGGVALLAPAWNCRPWAAKGLPVRPYRELSWSDRLNKATIPIRNSLIYRALLDLPQRLWREACFFLSHRPRPFDYRRLTPNLQEYIYTDCDAFTSMDAHACIMYYLSRGLAILSHATFAHRVLARHEPVVIRQPFQAQQAFL